MSCRATLAVIRAFLHSVAQCTIVTAFFAFMCSMHKKLLKNDGYFMQFFVRSMNFFLPPQYIVLEPAKMRYFQLKSTIYCVRAKLAIRLEMLYHVRSTASHSIAHTYTDSAVLPRRTACAQRIVCRCVPCQVNDAQLKTLTRTARTAPLTASGSSKPAQHSAHTTANTPSKRISKSSVSYEGQVER